MENGILAWLLSKEGAYLSGEELSKELKVSRTAIWKQVQALGKQGYLIEAQPRKGYRLVSCPDIINPEELLTELSTERIGRRVLVYQELDSTNEEAKRQAQQGACEGTLILAETQTRGKGRMGRLWASAEGRGLWFSLILRPKLEPKQAAHFVFIAAVAVCRALREASGVKASIKWPNDVLIEGKKVCGILTELSAEIDRINYIVLGIGINVSQEIEDFLPEIRTLATSIALAGGRSLRRVKLLQKILQELELEYHTYLEHGLSLVLEHWRALNTTLGKEVWVSAPDEIFTGWAQDVDEDGALWVKTDQEILKKVVVGDVSIKDKAPFGYIVSR